MSEELVGWSRTQDDEIVQMYREGAFAYEIAKKMRLPESTVRYVLKEHGILK